MYRTRINKIFAKEYESLLDAKKDLLLDMKSNPETNLVEVLDDSDNVVFTKEKEVVEEPTTELVENGVDSAIRNLIVNTWTSIDLYNSTIATLSSEGILDEKVQQTLELILDDLNVHIGALEELLAK